MSFKEKSIWISLISTVCIFGYYFLSLQGLGSLPIEEANNIAAKLIVKAVLMTILVEVILHIVVAIFSPQDAQEAEDERDKFYQMKANSIGYTILILGVIVTLGHILLGAILPEIAEAHFAATFPLLSAHILLFSFIISEVARFSSQVFFYRKGA
jgi:uncharacterized membrane protein